MSNRKKLVLSLLGVLIAMVPLVVCSYLAKYNLVSGVMLFALVLCSVVILVAVIVVAAKVDYATGIYVCRKCGCKFKPPFMEYLWAMHTISTRRLKCPSCGKKSNCKRVFQDNNPL